MKTHCEYECDEVNKLIGYEIVAAIIDGPGNYFGFRVRKGKKEMDVWVNCDPEGNGPGHLSIE